MKKKAEIERTLSNRIRAATEEAIIEAMAELNSAGHNFKPLDKFLYEWAEPGSTDSLKITCTIGVGMSVRHEAMPPVDPIAQAFMSLAESGEDTEATHLNLLEGDIANGGFMQLLDNKGERFLKESIVLLRKIGSKTALRIVEQALSLLQEERDLLIKHETFQKKIGRLNNRFWNLKESLPELFMQYRQKSVIRRSI